MEEGTCRSCKAPVVWIRLEASGKAIPCDPKVLVIVTDGGQIARGRVSHFATCPQAKDWRRA